MGSDDPSDSEGGSASPGSRSRSGSPASKASGSNRSRSSGSNRSRSGSPASKASGSGRSRSGSPASKASARSRSGSPGSKASGRSRSGSPASKGSARSRSGSPGSKASGRSRSGSPASKASGRSRSGSPASKASGRSGSAASKTSARSRSGSPASKRSASPAGSRRSGSPDAPTERKDVEDSGSDSDVGVSSKRKRGGGGGDSDSGSDIGRKSKRATIADDSEDEGGEKPETANVQQEDIFGDDLSISSEDEEKSKKAVIEDDDDSDRSVKRYGGDSDSEKEEKPAPEEEQIGEKEKEPEEPEEPIPETRIDVEVPKINTDLGREIHFVKLPNFLSIDCRPFDPEHYEDEIEDEDTLDDEGRARLKLKVENTIRWRQGKDEEGNLKKESNARFVKWSDGSYSLHLGNEVFDVYKQPLQGDFNHMFIRQGTGLQGQAVFRTKLSFRPHSTESFTHQKMTRSMADRSNKAAGIKVISQVGRDPEANRYKRMKEEEERLRASLRRDSKQKRFKERVPGRGLSHGYLEGEDEDEEGVSLAAIKNKYKKGNKSAMYTSDEEEDSDIETRKQKRLEKAKNALRDSDEESEGSRKSGSRSRSSSPARSGSESPKRKSGSDEESD